MVCGFSNIGLPCSIRTRRTILNSVVVSPGYVARVTIDVGTRFFCVPRRHRVCSTLSSVCRLDRAVSFISLLRGLGGGNICSRTNNGTCLARLMRDIPATTGILACITVVHSHCCSHRLLTTTRSVVGSVGRSTRSSSALLRSTRRGVCSVERNERVDNLARVGDIVRGRACSHLAGVTSPTAQDSCINVPANVNRLSGIVANLGGSSLVVLNTHPNVNGATFTLGVTQGITMRRKGAIYFFSLRVAHSRLTRHVLSDRTNVRDSGLHANRLRPSR